MKKIYGATDIGLVRQANQDTFATGTVSDNLCFAILCDGMGGSSGGNVASEMAAEHVSAVLKRELNEELAELSIRSIMMSAVSGANAKIFEKACADESLSGMGTTIIIAVFLRQTMYVACVGDSRVYLVSPEREEQITHDHTVVQMLVDLGEITREDAKTHPKRHFITRAVGVGPDVEVDFIVHELSEEDIILICSDGLYNYLEQESIYGLVKPCVERESVDSLIEYAKAGGGTDNITALVYGG